MAYDLVWQLRLWELLVPYAVSMPKKLVRYRINDRVWKVVLKKPSYSIFRYAVQ